MGRTPEALLTPLVVARNAQEQVLIEPSINSVRLSIRIKQADDIERILAHKVRASLASSTFALAERLLRES